MIRRELIPHTADIRLKVEADTLERLFEGALQGMGDLLKENSCNEKFSPQLSEAISVSSVDLTTLLIDFLSQALTLSFEKRVVFCLLRIDQMNETSLTGWLEGSVVDDFEEDIKAVTYHEANVQKKESGNWETVI